MTKTPHRFFRVMVLMTSGTALGCGGLSTERGDDPSPGPSGGGGGSSGSAGNPPTGGSVSIGGFTGTAGATASGGMAGAGGAPQPGPFECPPAQWDCSEITPSCSYADWGWELPEGCSCDEKKPLTASDCAENESFVCRQGSSFEGNPLSEPIPFECSCQPTQDACQYACSLAFPDLYDSSCNNEPEPILCGCAVVYLK